MMAVGAFWAAAVVAVRFPDHRLLFWASVAMMLASGVPTFPPVFRRVVRLLGVGRRSERVEEGLARVGGQIWLSGWLLNTLGWVFLGLSLWAVVCSMGGAAVQTLVNLHVYIASVSLATVAGFISFVPGGAIVREAVLAEVMRPEFGEMVAVISAVMLRLVWLVSELVLSGILYVGARRVRSRPEPPSSGE